MAFALTKAQFIGVEFDECITNKFMQYIHLKITAANTDVDFDLGDVAGTLWGALDGSDAGLDALNAFKQVLTLKESFISLSGLGINDYAPVRTGGTAKEVVWSFNATSLIPELAYVSGSAPTVYDVMLCVLLSDGANPINDTFV